MSPATTVNAIDAPIGIFDSGIGGLTVLKELLGALPAERFIYLGDTARVPYGAKSAATVTRYAENNSRFLMRQGIKLLVVACNTASAVALDALGRSLPVPVVGVTLPGAAAALTATRNRRIGVIGTAQTIASNAYDKALARLADGAVTVYSQPCPLFVPLAEEGWSNTEVAMEVARHYLSPLRDAHIDTLILGCTHYPLLRTAISKAVGEEVAIIDSATAVAAAVREMLIDTGLAAKGSTTTDERHRALFFVTDVPHRFAEIGAAFLGTAISDVEQVDIF